MSGEQVGHGPAGDAEKGAAGKAAEEAANDERLDVLRHGAGDQPDQEQE